MAAAPIAKSHALWLLSREYKGDSNGTIELSELVRHAQGVVLKIAADMGVCRTGRDLRAGMGEQRVRVAR